MARGVIERIGGQATMEVVAGSNTYQDTAATTDHAEASRRLLDWLAMAGFLAPGGVDAVGHRVVHGGSRFIAPTRLDDDVIAAIAALRDLAPLHNEPALEAIEAGRSVDTSMGFTPLEGLMMSTRSGDLDPALPGFLARQEGVDTAEIEAWLNTRSGLLGVSGHSKDMRELLKAEAQGDAWAALAVDMFCYHIRKCIAAYLAVLNGAEAIVFGGGIGENRRPCASASVPPWTGVDCGLLQRAMPQPETAKHASARTTPACMLTSFLLTKPPLLPGTPPTVSARIKKQ